MAGLTQWLNRETGLQSLRTYGNKDIYLILLTRFLRMFAYGGAALVLAVFLWIAGYGKQIGTFMTLTLLGDAAISYGLTIVADKLGRRRVLMVGSLLMAFSGAVFALTKNWYLLLFAAIVGVITPGAHEVGPFRAVEEAILAQLSPLEARTDVFAWFAVSSTVAMACGLFVTGMLTWAQRTYLHRDWKETYQPIFGVYAVIGLIKFFVTLLLSDNCEASSASKYAWAATTTVEEVPSPSSSEETNLLSRRSSTAKQPRTSAAGPAEKTLAYRLRKSLASPWKVSRSSLPILLRLSFLYALNAFAAGMLPLTLMAWYVNFRNRWFLMHRVGYVLSAVWLFSSLSNLFSAAVARRLGLVRAMVYTHLPCALFLALIPLAAKTWYLLAVLLLADGIFGSMDQAPREAFVAAVFLPRERTQAIGTLNFVRTLAASLGPMVSVYVWTKEKWWIPFELAAVLKICYDVGLLVMFLNTPLPEERRRSEAENGSGGQQEMSMTAAEMDVNILMDEYSAQELTPPSAFDISDDEEEEEDHHTLVGDEHDVGVRRKYGD
ncbi:hypothetical protein LTR10_023710 [Elasticomyces elasticus]|nr:hypothetical protein LTR10_023710 [Elasticomyces elasticus]KAK5183953.1 hypothetical protein LTR44_003458 [Eurotiomycetes sp. CCFEE 6388]